MFECEKPENQLQEIPASEIPKIELISAIKSKVSDSNNDELMTLLNDIEAKIKNSESVPSYLINALKDQTKDIIEISQEVSELLASL